jgi:hypothetical protein
LSLDIKTDNTYLLLSFSSFFAICIKRKLIKYEILVTPNKANIPGVPIKYKLIGNDHKNAINIKNFFDVKEEMIAKLAGRNNIRNVITAKSAVDIE